MVRASIYIEKSIWQGIREEAHERWIPIGKLIAELYESRKVHKVHKSQVADIRKDKGFTEEVESPSTTVAETEGKKKNIKKTVEKIPSVQSASNVFNPQPKGKK